MSLKNSVTRPILSLVPRPAPEYEYTEPAPEYDARGMDPLQSVCYLLDRLHEIEILAPKAINDEMIHNAAIQGRIAEIIALLETLQTERSVQPCKTA